MSTTITLTDRELALARGDNPDDPEPNPPLVNAPEEEATETPEPVESVEPQEEAAEEPESAEVEESSWIDDEIRDLAASYRMTDDDLSVFGSADEFRRAGMLFDRQLMARQEKTEETKPEPKPEPKAEPAAEKPKDSKKRIDPQAYRDAGYDDETVALAETVAELQRAREEEQQAFTELRTWQQQYQQQLEQEAQQRAAWEFHEAVDKLDEKLVGRAFDATGNPVDLDQKFHDARSKIWAAKSTIESHIANTGAARPSASALMQRAVQLAFPEATFEKRSAQRVEQAKQQSAKRRPVGSQATARPARVSDSDDPREIANDPRILEFWNRAQENAGAK